jgi:hypothetical protein
MCAAQAMRYPPNAFKRVNDDGDVVDEDFEDA